MAGNLRCCWISSSSQKPRGKIALHHLSGGTANTTQYLVGKQRGIVTWDCLISHTAFAHVDGWRRNMTLSYIITPNTMSLFARGEQKQANVLLHEMWGCALMVTRCHSSSEGDIPDSRSFWGVSSSVGLHWVLNKGTWEQMWSAPMGFHPK